jgi:CBS-domain-containing membrane protein
MTNLKVKDVMTRTVVVAREDTPFKEVVRLMHEHRVSGLPVLDAEDRLVGIVTEADLLDVETGPADSPGRRFIEWFIHPARLAEIEARADDLRAGDIMTPNVVTIDPEMTVRQGARSLLDAGVKRLPWWTATGGSWGSSAGPTCWSRSSGPTTRSPRISAGT